MSKKSPWMMYLAIVNVQMMNINKMVVCICIYLPNCICSQKGVDELSAGLKSDQEGQFRDAVKHYKNGLAQLLFCRKCKFYIRVNNTDVCRLGHFVYK